MTRDELLATVWQAIRRKPGILSVRGFFAGDIHGLLVETEGGSHQVYLTGDHTGQSAPVTYEFSTSWAKLRENREKARKEAKEGKGGVVTS